MATFLEIPGDEMHNFLVNNGFKLLNPPRGRPLPSFISPEHVVKTPSPEFYSPIPTLELTYGRRVTPQGPNPHMLTLRIYTTIDPNGCREKGSDAIRITLFTRPTEIRNNQEIALPPKLIGGERKCLRVKGWKANLQSRIDKWPEMIGPPCPKCGSPTAERDGTKGKFWSCIRWSRQGPSCNGTINAGNEHLPHCSCGRVMKERTGRNGTFLGCTGYPACTNTKPLPQNQTA